MEKIIITVISGLIIGLSALGPAVNTSPDLAIKKIQEAIKISAPARIEKNEVIGFLPYWLVDQADKDYSQYVTTLTYFNLVVNPDGTIRRYDDPGWQTLQTGKADRLLNEARDQNVKLSLLVFNADSREINSLVSDPVTHADTLVSEVAPVMRQYGFTDLNLDIESVALADPQSRQNFTIFVNEVKKNMDEEGLGTLTIDISPSVMFGHYLFDVAEIGKTADYVVLMAYDFSYAGSQITGPVAPVGDGSGFDTSKSVVKALELVPKEKIILGVPLYGYGWRTWSAAPYAPTIPGSGYSTSNRYIEQFAQSQGYGIRTDDYAKESYVIYPDGSGGYRQVFFPDATSTQEKINLANSHQIRGMALWALGYEGNTILNPLVAYKQAENDVS